MMVLRKASARVEDLSKCMAPRGLCCLANGEKLISESNRILSVRNVFVSFILGVLMAHLWGALVFTSSICRLMSLLAGIMFFLLHLLMITLSFCPSEPLTTHDAWLLYTTDSSYEPGRWRRWSKNECVRILRCVTDVVFTNHQCASAVLRVLYVNTK